MKGARWFENAAIIASVTQSMLLIFLSFAVPMLDSILSTSRHPTWLFAPKNAFLQITALRRHCLSARRLECPDTATWIPIGATGLWPFLGSLKEHPDRPKYQTENPHPSRPDFGESVASLIDEPITTVAVDPYPLGDPLSP